MPSEALAPEERGSLAEQRMRSEMGRGKQGCVAILGGTIFGAANIMEGNIISGEARATDNIARNNMSHTNIGATNIAEQ